MVPMSERDRAGEITVLFVDDEAGILHAEGTLAAQDDARAALTIRRLPRSAFPSASPGIWSRQARSRCA